MDILNNMTEKKHMSENFRLITPINTVINTALSATVLFFLTQQYFRIDHIEEKQYNQSQDIYQIKGYLHLTDNDIKNVVQMCTFERNKPS